MTSHHRMTLAPNGQSRAGGAHKGDYLSLNDYDFTSLILHVVIFLCNSGCYMHICKILLKIFSFFWTQWR